ncbi:MAG: Sec-independent protein translocase protein TatB [Arcobacteraceae bacterium]
MFGMGFMEIFLVLIVAVIALGPEKLPGAAVDIVKFFKKFKNSIDDAKSTLDTELNISQMKKEADEFKSSVSNIKNIASIDMNEISNLDYTSKTDESKEKQKEKPSKKETISLDENKAV